MNRTPNQQAESSDFGKMEQRGRCNVTSGARPLLIGAAALLAAASLFAAGRGSEQAPPAKQKAAPPSGVRVQTLAQWRRADQELLEAAQTYVGADERRRKLVEGLARSKKKLVPGDVTPSSIMARRAITGVFTEYDQLLGEFRAVQSRAWAVARAAYASREELNQQLLARKAELHADDARKVSSLSSEARYEADRVDLWLRSLDQAEKEGPHQIVLGVLGAELGYVLLFSHSAIWRGDGGDRPGGTPARLREGAPRGKPSGEDENSDHPLTPKEKRDKLLERKQELQTFNLRAQERMGQRTREIERIEFQLMKIDQGRQQEGPAAVKEEGEAAPSPKGP